MKKIIIEIFSLFICILLMGCAGKVDSTVTANPDGNTDIVSGTNAENDPFSLSEAEEENAENEELWDYPIKDWETAKSSGLDFMGWKKVCNPPEDILKNLSTEKLAWLTVRYPLFAYMPSGGTDSEANIFIGVYEDYSSIFHELMQREDRNICLLNEFAQNELDVETLNSGAYLENESIWIEVFIEQYLLVHSLDLTAEERAYYLEIVKEKTEKYYSKIDNNIFGLVFDSYGIAYRESSYVEKEGSDDDSSEEPCSVSFSVYPKEGELSDNLYKCITGEKKFQYVVEQFNEDHHVEYVSVEQNIMDFTYALPFLESDGTQIRMDMEFKEYAISDLDGDGTDELIYYVYPGGDGYFLIFHDFGETVCAYGLRYRSVGRISYDGCMEGVDGASRGNIWKFTSFSTSGYETEEISKFDSDSDEYIVLGEPVSQEEAVSFFWQNRDKEEIAWIR